MEASRLLQTRQHPAAFRQKSVRLQWSAMEKKYGRDLVREQRDIKTASPGERPIIGFFGMNAGISFEKIAGLSQTAAAQKDGGGLADHSLPCDCTD